VPQAVAAAPTFGRLGRRVSALSHAQFRVYWVGILLSEGANNMFLVASAWLVYELAKPPLNVALLLGALGFCRMIPMCVLVLIGGVAADRFGRRRILLATNATAAIVALTFAFLSFADRLNVWLVLLAAFLMGCTMAFNRPAHQAFIHDLVVEHTLHNAVALIGLNQNAVRIGAPLLAGGLLAAGGGTAALLCVAGGYAGMVALMLTLRMRTTSIARTNALSSLGEVFRYIRSDPTVRGLLLIETIPGLFALPYTTLLPIFAGSVFHRGADGLGLMQSMVGIGALGGTVTLTAMSSNLRHRGALLLCAIATFGMALILFGLIHDWPLALVLLAVIGMSDAFYIFTINGLLLARSPAHLRGRVMSVFTLADVGMSPLGSVLIGGFAGVFGATVALAASGGVTVALVSAAATRFPRMRRM